MTNRRKVIVSIDDVVAMAERHAGKNDHIHDGVSNRFLAIAQGISEDGLPGLTAGQLEARIYEHTIKEAAHLFRRKIELCECLGAKCSKCRELYTALEAFITTAKRLL